MTSFVEFAFGIDLCGQNGHIGQEFGERHL